MIGYREISTALKTNNTYDKWDLRFLALARHVSSWSKDPSTRVGAVVARGKDVISLGYNGFPKGCDDDPALYANRDVKLSRVVHGEINAIVLARQDLRNCTLYTWPFPTCDRCAGIVIQTGITRVVAPELFPEMSRWRASVDAAMAMFSEVGISVTLYTGELPNDLPDS